MAFAEGVGHHGSDIVTHGLFPAIVGYAEALHIGGIYFAFKDTLAPG